jgi:hypothetical protein
MSPVIQKLENAAITTPNPYRRSDSISTTHTSHSTQIPVSSHTPVSPPSGTPVGQQQVAAFAPMAYNPSAPAAPEPIAHREKTPPPPDAENGTGLMGPAGNSQGGQYPFPGPPQQAQFNPQQTQFSPQQTPYMPGPPSMAPPGPGIQRSHTLGPISTPSSIPGPPPQSPFAASFAPPPRATPPQDPNAHLYGDAPPTPGLQRQATMPAGYTPGQPQQAAPTQYASYPSTYAPGGQAPPTPGHPPTPGYAPLQSPSFYPQQTGQQQYAYGAHDQASAQHGIHNIAYQPEGATKPAQAGQGQAGATGKFEQRADKIEKGVSRFLKKLDKKF